MSFRLLLLNSYSWLGKLLYKVISTSLIALEPLTVITNVEGPWLVL